MHQRQRVYAPFFGDIVEDVNQKAAVASVSAASVVAPIAVAAASSWLGNWWSQPSVPRSIAAPEFATYDQQVADYYKSLGYPHRDAYTSDKRNPWRTEGTLGLSAPSRQSQFFSQGSSQDDGNMYKRARSMRAPVATTSSVNFQAAERSIILSGREYVSTLSAASSLTGYPSNFQTTSSLLRPTDFSLFSWLAGISTKFEEFKFLKLNFVFEPQCPTTTSGSIALWFDGDPTHAPPTDWNSVINTGANVHGAPWAKHVFSVPAHLYSSRKSYYITNEFPDASKQASAITGFANATDPLEYYPGIFGFASVDVLNTTGVTTSLPLGKVYLDYTIGLRGQNVDGWNTTSLISKSAINAEAAMNSGSGFILQAGTNIVSGGTTLAVDCTQGDGATIFGYNSVASTKQAPAFQSATVKGAVVVAAGSQYFTIGANSALIAKQDLELVMDVGCTLSASDAQQTVVRIDRVNNSVPIIFTSATNYGSGACTPATSATELGYASQIKGIYSTGTGAAVAPPSFVGCPGTVQAMMIRLKKGDALSYTIKAAASTLLGFTVGFTPMPFNLTL